MTKRPLYSSYWDNRRQAVTHKIEIQGTGKFLLFTEETFADLMKQVQATKAADDRASTST